MTFSRSLKTKPRLLTKNSPTTDKKTYRVAQLPQKNRRGKGGEKQPKEERGLITGRETRDEKGERNTKGVQISYYLN